MTPTASEKLKMRRFYQAAPLGAHFLNADDADGIVRYLGGRRWLTATESVTAVTSVGLGNMNYLVRIDTGQRSFILKQSRPWVEKFPDIPAPFDRALIEAKFYGLLSNSPTARFLPKLYWFDGISRILCLEDLGVVGDCSFLYAGATLSQEDYGQLCEFLSLLHAERVHLSNLPMRQLNHFHIFVFPFQFENKFDLDAITPGLQSVADHIKRSDRMCRRIKELGLLYLSEGDHLIHGDFYPGSWLKTGNGFKVIDPEFGFSGPREFDFGVLFAHLRIVGNNIDLALTKNCYAGFQELNLNLVFSFAGIEILRRLLGVAQLPVRLNLEQKKSLLMEAIEYLD